jgi:hypothetical protein
VKISLHKFFLEVSGNTRNRANIIEHLTRWDIPYDADAPIRMPAIDARYIGKARKAYKAEERERLRERTTRATRRVLAHARMVDDAADVAPESIGYAPPLLRDHSPAARLVLSGDIASLERRLDLLERAFLGNVSELRRISDTLERLEEQIGQLHKAWLPEIGEALQREHERETQPS